MRFFALLVATAALSVGVGPASISVAFAEDASACASGVGDPGIVACTRAIASGLWRGRDLAWAYGSRGKAHLAKGDADLAIADFNEAIQLDPELALSYYRRGNVYRAKGDNDLAIADYDQAIRLDPKDAAAYSNRGVAYYGKGDNDRAIADYDAVIRLDPKDAAAYSNRGVAYNAKGDNDRAIADYDTVIRIAPDAFTYSNRSIAYRDKGDNDRAIADCDQAIRLDPKFTVAYLNRGSAYLRQGGRRTGHRQLQPGDPPRSQRRGRLQRSRHCLLFHGRQRPGHRRPHPRD